MDNWIPVKTALPTKDGSYLTTVQHSNKFSSIMILGFVKDLYKFEKTKRKKKESANVTHSP
jgi:hypothetical protein